MTGFDEIETALRQALAAGNYGAAESQVARLVRLAEEAAPGAARAAVVRRALPVLAFARELALAGRAQRAAQLQPLAALRRYLTPTVRRSTRTVTG